MVAHFFGIAQQPVVLMLVLGTGACTAFQLLLNECLAAGHARGTFSTTKSQLTRVLVAQVVTCATTLISLPNNFFTPTLISTLCALLFINSALSYQCAVIYYRLAICKQISVKQAIVIGALPGFTALFIYGSFSLASHILPALPAILLLSSVIVPSLIQWLYLRLLSPPSFIGQPAREERPQLIYLIGAVVALTILSVVITILRDSIAATYVAYAALIVVALNSLASLTNTLTRASFLTSSSYNWYRVILTVGFSFGVLGIAVWPFTQVPAKLLVLLGVQLVIIALIEAARRLPTISNFKK